MKVSSRRAFYIICCYCPCYCYIDLFIDRLARFPGVQCVFIDDAHDAEWDGNQRFVRKHRVRDGAARPLRLTV